MVLCCGLVPSRSCVRDSGAFVNSSVLILFAASTLAHPAHKDSPRPAPNRPQITHSPHFPLLELGGDLVWLEEAWLRGVDRHAKLARRRPYELDGVLVGSIGGG